MAGELQQNNNYQGSSIDMCKTVSVYIFGGINSPFLFIVHRLLVSYPDNKIRSGTETRVRSCH